VTVPNSLENSILRTSNLIAEQLQRLPAENSEVARFTNQLQELLQADRTGIRAGNAVLGGLRQLRYLVDNHARNLGKVRVSLSDAKPANQPSVSQSDISKADAPQSGICFTNLSLWSQKATVPEQAMAMTRETDFSIAPSLLFSLDAADPEFDPVSPTAKIVAYLRSLDPQLHFQPAAPLLEIGRQLVEALELDAETLAALAELFQIRHHALDVALERACVRQIVELAAGISPRGFHWYMNHPDSVYVESDLPALMIRKAKLLRDAIPKSNRQTGGLLHCCGTNVMNHIGLEKTLDLLDAEQPFALVCEGLLLYFSQGEMDIFLDNMAKLLRDHPSGVWITDLVTRADLLHVVQASPGVAQGVRRVFEGTGRSVIAGNPLQDLNQATAVMAGHGLRITPIVALREIAAARRRRGLQSGQLGRQPEMLLGERKIWSVQSVSANGQKRSTGD
jgi:hypothetical protein